MWPFLCINTEGYVLPIYCITYTVRICNCHFLENHLICAEMEDLWENNVQVVGNNEVKRRKSLQVRSHPLPRGKLKPDINSRSCVCLCVYMGVFSVSQKKMSFVGVTKAVSLKCYSTFVQYFYYLVHLCIHHIWSLGNWNNYANVLQAKDLSLQKHQFRKFNLALKLKTILVCLLLVIVNLFVFSEKRDVFR